MLPTVLPTPSSKTNQHASEIFGIWNCTGVQYQMYTNNQVTQDSTAHPGGELTITFGGYASSNLPHSPFSPFTYAEWEITKQEFNQISFTAYNGISTLFSNVVEITHVNKRKLVLTQCNYDNDLHLHSKITWTFDRLHI